ncbi:MAG: MFS transporter [Hydrogenophaga sp.]
MTVSPAVPAWGLSPRAAVGVFLAFALAYFFSTLIRAVTATLAPVLSDEMLLGASDLGLLAGGYFLGFALTQLPMGGWLDRYGPRRVILAFLCVAVMGCAAFALATSFTGLLAARVLTGMGVSACLMAPLTGYRRWLRPELLLRANAWMLMSGSLGMVAATLPVQWLLPVLGWRGLFWVLCAMIVLSMAALLWRVPGWHGPGTSGGDVVNPVSYAQIVRHPFFRQMAGIGFVFYGGMLAIQTLWAGPWLVKVAAASPAQAAQGLFGINLCMLVTFWIWGLLHPGLARRGWSAERLIAWGVPMAIAVLAFNVVLGPQAGWPMWALFCVFGSVGALAQPAVGMALPAQAAGRALSAYNLVIFAGVFVMQWAMGLAADALAWLGWDEALRLRGAVGLFGVWAVLVYAGFWRVLRQRADGR